MKNLLLVIFVISCVRSFGQIVSQFNFDADPVTTAAIGPDATSISGSAFSDAGGVGGTNGLNAGLPKANIDMIIPGSPTFDIDGIDVSFDYQREENSGDFFVRGSSLQIRGCANLSVIYRVEDGGGGFTTVNSGNVYAIPNDDIFRNYRFAYTPCDGLGRLIVDGVVVWSNDGPDERNMYWTGSGDVTIGRGIDGTGFNNTFLDNLTIGDIDCSLLPIEMTNFDVRSNSDCSVKITWETKSERNNSHFLIQRSQDGINWTNVGQRTGANNSTETLSYQFEDTPAGNGIFYYRVQQVDFNGTSETFDPKSVIVNNCMTNYLYPNPTKQMVYTGNIDLDSAIEIYGVTGVLYTDKVQVDHVNNVIDLSELSAGAYVIQINGETHPIIKID